MTVPIIHKSTAVGDDTFVLRSRTRGWDVVRGYVVTEVWTGLYANHAAKVEALKAAGAYSISPSHAGATCSLTASFSNIEGSSGSGGSGGGGPVQPITIQWGTEPQVHDVDIKLIRTWGPDGDPLSATNKDRADKLTKIDGYIARDQLDIPLASGSLGDNFKKYAVLKAGGINGAMRAHYAVTKTTTWAKQDDVKGYVDYSKQFKVISWGAIPGKPAWLDEPQYRDVDTSGAWRTVSMEWLTMPPRAGLVGRTLTLVESWLGAYKWKGELYDGGTG